MPQSACFGSKDWPVAAHSDRLMVAKRLAHRPLRWLQVSPGSSRSCSVFADSTTSWQRPLEGTTNKPPVVALGKFDALHKGHRSLVTQAANLGGYPWLISFSGMAEVLGWPERPPLVPDCDRSRVLESWAPHCQGCVPRLRLLPFSEVRGMSPVEFVALLAQQLQVAGVVVGQGYRFGYRQTGDAELLGELGQQAGLKVVVSNLVGAGAAGRVGKVSSSEVRKALLLGKMGIVQDCLGRRYRLIADISSVQPITRIPVHRFLNQLPGQKAYKGDVYLQRDQGSSVELLGSEISVGEATVSISHPDWETAAAEGWDHVSIDL